MFGRKKCFILGFILSVLSLGIIGCSNNKSAPTNQDNKVVENNNIKLADLGEIKLPDGIEIRNDIPFILLVDKELIKNIPDSINIDKYRPDYIVLKKGFNENDSTQLEAFPNITISTLISESGTPLVLGEQSVERLVNRVLTNIAGTPYQIEEWKNVDSSFLLSDGTPCVIFEYVQKHKDTGRKTNISNFFILKDGKLINIIMSSPNETYEEWNGYLKKIVNNIKFN